MRYQRFYPAFARFPVFVLALSALIAVTSIAKAGDRDRIQAFLEITGFDVALDSIALSAASAPEMLGMDSNAFGSDWNRLTDEVFDTGVMRKMALDILEATLSDDLLNHAAAFYASDLGQRLVVAENASHMETDDDAKRAGGEALIADMVRTGSPRLELINRMTRAIDVSGSSLRALQEIQVRFLMSASAAGVVELRMDANELRAFFKSREGEMRRAIQKSALSGAAQTYRGFSDDDVLAYVEALEEAQMMRVYELLNAVQYEVMANRFEELARRMAELHPGQDI
ncbi:MAG: DUF2059 domain-containing protein [Sedimentitalea sp.]